MKKKISLLIILLLSIYIIPVHAEDAWPKSFTSGDFTYSIEDVVLKVYEVTKQNSDNGEVFLSDKYLSGTPDSTIQLPVADYTISPESTTRKYNGIDIQLADINLNVTKEKLTTLLQSQMSAASSTKCYIVELAVKYKFTDYPSSTYPYVYKTNFIRDLMNTIGSNNNGLHVITPTEVNEQVINVITIDYKDSSPILEYETTATSDNGLGSLVFNPQSFYKTEPTASETKSDYIFMFHNIDNIDFVIDGINDIINQDTPRGNSQDPAQDEQVKVDDTAKSIPILLYFASLVSLLVGSGLVIYTIEKDKQKQNG